MPMLFDSFQALFIGNLAAAGLSISSLGLAAAWILKRRSAVLLHAILLATVILTLCSPLIVAGFSLAELGWFPVSTTSAKTTPRQRPTPPARPKSRPAVTEKIPKSGKPKIDAPTTAVPEKPAAERVRTMPAVAKTNEPSTGRPLRLPKSPNIEMAKTSNPKPNATQPIFPRRVRPPATPKPKPPSIRAPLETNIAQHDPTAETKSASPLSWIASGFAGLWLLGILIGVFRLLRDWRVLVRIRRSRIPLDDPRIGKIAQTVSADLNLNANLRVDISPLVPVPVSLGGRSAGIVLPQSLAGELTDRQLRDVFVHEAAHLIRRDHWTGLMQRMAAILFWWNPPLHFVNRRLSVLREQICDEYVLAQGGSGAGFAETLVRVAEASLKTPPKTLPATSLLSHVDELTNRLAHLLQGTRAMSLKLTRKTLALVSAFSLCAGIVCCLPLVRADQESKPEQKPASENSQKATPAKEQTNDREEKERREDEEYQRKLKQTKDRQELQKLMLERQQVLVKRAKAQRERDDRLARLEAIQYALVRRMVDNGSPGERLFGALAWLDENRKFTDPGLTSHWDGIEGLKLFLKENLAHGTRDVTADQLAKWVKEAKGEFIDNFRKVEAEYVKLSGKPSPFDWMEQSRMWSQVADDFLSPGDGKQLATRWAKWIETDPKHKEFYVLLYLEQIRLRKPKTADPEVLSTFYSGEGIGFGSGYTRMLMVLAAWDAVNLPRDHDYRKSLWEQLLKRVREKRMSIQAEDHLLLSRVFREFWRGLTAEARTALVTAFLNHDNRNLLRLMAYMADVDPAAVRRWYLSKSLDERIEFVNTPFRDALGLMKDVSDADVWLDPWVDEWEKELNLTVRGTWLDALDQLLAKTPFESVLLDDGIVWIGPPEKRKSIIERHRRITALGEGLPELKESVDIEFIDTPFRDAMDFLGDAHDIPIWLENDIDGQTPITLTLNWLPLYVTLEMICERAGAKWGVLGHNILIGTEKSFPNCEQAIEGYRQHQVTLTRLSLAENPLAEKLQSLTDIKFVDTPLKDTIAFLSELHKIPIAVIGQDGEQTFNAYTATDLAEALTILLSKHEMTWDTDGAVVLVGDRKMLKRYRMLIAKPPVGIEKAPAKVKTALQMKVKIDYDTESAKTPAEKAEVVRKAIDELASQHSVKIIASAARHKVCAENMPWLNLKDIPLKTVLDVLANAGKTEWWISDDGNIKL